MKIVLTGSSSGIGKKLVVHLCAEGHTVVGLARSPQTKIKDGGEFLPMACDVSDWGQTSDCVEAVLASHGSIDALICCAGTQSPIGAAMSADPKKWAENIQTNLGGTFNSIRAFYSVLAGCPRRQKIICFSGGGATGPRANFSAYACAKSAIVRLVETLDEEWAGGNIDINAVAPGAIATAMTEEVRALGPEITGLKEFSAAQKLSETGEQNLVGVTGLIDYLLSPMSDGISGRLISARWDPWGNLHEHRSELAGSDIYRLRRIVPEDRNLKWA